jgi:exonuclease SbcC
MEILSVTLKNFKSHSDRHFVFQPGTNAICGENGAGKTSILEAIAWTLFNYRGAYRTEDLIRNGANSAQATISFISNRDGRTYQVQRCTTRGYTLYDPQLGEKLDYKNIEAEILPWLRQQLGVAPGTDLARLFANTIGVPQGMFTADFLQPTETRKKIFDGILKVDEYRQTNQDLLSLEKYSRAEAEALERAIAQYEETLADWEGLQQRQQTLNQEIIANQVTLQQLQVDLERLQGQRERLTAQAQRGQQLEAQWNQLTVQVEAQQQARFRLSESLERAEQAVKICEANRAPYQAYLQAEETLKALDQQVRQRQTLIKQREKQQNGLATQQAELTKLTLQLERLNQAEAEIAQLQPLIAQQVELEQRQNAIVEHLNQLQAIKAEYKNLVRQQAKLAKEQAQLQAEIARIQAFAPQVKQIAEIEQKRDRLQEQLSRVEAAKQFEAELRQLVSSGEEKRDRHQIDTEQVVALIRNFQQASSLVPGDVLEATLTALGAGVILNTELLNALWRILADLSEQISVPKLQQQLQQIKTKLDEAYQRRAELATLESKQVQQTHLQQEIQQTEARLQQLTTAIAQEAEGLEQRSQLMVALQQLTDPRGRSQLLERELQKRMALHAQYLALNAQQEPIRQAIADLEAKLTQFETLDEQIEQQKQLRQIHQSDYLLYLERRNDANQFKKLTAELQTVVTQLEQLEANKQRVQDEINQLQQDHDPQQWQLVEATYTTTRSQADQLAGGLPQQQQRLAELDNQIVTLQATAEKRDRAQVQLKQKEKNKRFVSFARRAYKEAGPRITERYVRSISHEADRLFRELLNRPNVALEWTREYEILVQEGAHPRRFINLSGGEQMCAALAVRLALLRVLADIDVAFFDEPTTNMDQPRRESLAEAIANIKSFRQLFVISHDDTFEKVTENVIVIERELS